MCAFPAPRQSCYHALEMSDSIIIGERRPSLGEEVANSISHGIGLVLAIIATPILVIGAIRYGSLCSSTRRFCARPSSVSFDATGLLFP